MTPVLQLTGFGLAFDARVILQGVSFEVPAHGCTVLLGPSGTGKSTLLRTLAGLTEGHPQLRLTGQALYQGTPCTGRHRPALVEQKSQLLVSTVLENLVCELPDRSRLTRAMQIARLSTRLEQLGQEALLDQLSCQVIDLPVAQQRIVAILRKAMAKPALQMVDEPTANLAPEEAAPIVALLRRLARQRPLLVVMHHLTQTRELADQVILIANGVTQEQAPTERFFNAPRSEAAQQFLRTGSCPETGLNPHADETPEAAPDTTSPRQSTEAAAPSAPPTPMPEAAPPVGALARNAAWGPRGFVWLLPGQLAGTPWPGIVRDTAQDLRALHEVGVTRLLSLTETPFPATRAAEHGLTCAASPMPDMQAPTLDQAVRLCEDIDRFLAAGDCVAVHCKAGLGRTGTVLGAYWLWRHRGQLTGAQALAHIRQLEAAMVQSRPQEEFFDHFADLVKAHCAAPEPVH